MVDNVKASRKRISDYPHLVKEWHPTLNKDKNINDISAGSHKKAHWLCPEGHPYEAQIKSRAYGNTGCAYCKNQKILVGYNDLATTHPQIAAQIHPTLNGKIRAEDLLPGSPAKLIWLCEKNHDWETEIRERTSGSGCPVCSNRKLLIGYNDLQTLHPLLAKEWHPTKNGSLTAQQVVGAGEKKYWWQCSTNTEHSWNTDIYKRISGRNCPTCNVGGYSPDVPSTFYFIYHPDMLARKIGIANNHAGRIQEWEKRGWVVLYTITENRGHEIQQLERTILQWIRKDLKMPQELKKQDMGKPGGWSETFSPYGISNEDIILKINNVWEEVKL